MVDLLGRVLHAMGKPAHAMIRVAFDVKQLANVIDPGLIDPIALPDLSAVAERDVKSERLRRHFLASC